MDANLKIERLYVLTESGQVAYDERFHPGVNIIRGDNSSGKSTITHLLFYGLGGDYTHFVRQAQHCSEVWVQTCISGATLTLQRLLRKDDHGHIQKQQGMTLYWCTLDEALAHPEQGQTYGYKHTPHRRSFSSVLFEALDIPQAQADSNLTLHQLLRLLYIDQESPTSSLFYYEQFDSQQTRETVAELLMGIFDEALYQAKIRLNELDTRLRETKSNLHSLEKLLSKDQRSSAFLQGEIDRLLREEEKYDLAVQQLRTGQQTDLKIKPQINEQKKEVQQLTLELQKTEEQEFGLNQSITDTELFLHELRRKQAALRQTLSTRQLMGTLRLTYCPECLNPLPDHVPPGTCRLCKSPTEHESDLTHVRRLLSEISFQLTESEEILANDVQSKEETHTKALRLRTRLRSAQRQLDHLLKDVTGTTDRQLEDLYYQKGQVQGELLQYHTMLESARYYERLIAEQQTLKADKEQTERFIEAKQQGQEKHREAVLAAIRRFAVYFLHHDLQREKAFTQARPEEFFVNFTQNLTYLQSEHAKYSASSTFFLKLVARFSLFFASLELPWMRFPRFIFADNMEDKGIETPRAQHFQKTLIEKLKEYPDESYQLIYTTSYITPELNESPYVVGEYYTSEHKSLRNV